MLISLNWIREFCPFESAESPAEIGARFSLHTAEVEQAAARCAGLGSILVARILKVDRHPDADRLTVVEVDVGPGGRREVVCGAPNVRPGLLVPYAAPGTVIGGREIREAKVRGVLSRGMLCSEKELEVSAESSGLWELPEEVVPGASIASLYPGLPDVILEVDNKSITHRPDLWGHHGIAREFSVIYRTELRPLDIDPALASARGKSAIKVSIEKGIRGRDGLCRRYCGLQIDGVKVGPSPPWLQHRLLSLGLRPINNIVDITNAVLLELGQPLHAFDTERIEGGDIRVRRAAEGESLRLLDDSEVMLEPDDLVIADARSPVALAGIMGGAGSQIAESTTSIFLESANFAPARVRRTSVRIGKRTDSALRFEKSLDPENARLGILRAAKLVLELSPGARVAGPLQDVGHEAPEPIVIAASAAEIAARLGTDIPAGEVRGTLERLGFTVSGKDEGAWKVRVPGWRATKDISIREDLVEEVGRIHGYDRIRPFAPAWPVEAPGGNEERRFERSAKEFLVLHGGLCEVLTYSMVGAAHLKSFGLDPEAHLRLMNPISEDMDRLRREIVPLLLEKARENQRYVRRFGFFEVGRVYRKEPLDLRKPVLPDERRRIAGILSFEEKKPANFHEARHIVLALLERLRIARPSVAPPGKDAALEPWAHPAVHGRVLAGASEVGAVYRVHPAVEARLELEGDVLAFDLDLGALFAAPRRQVEYRPPLRYPTVPFDVAVVAPERVPVEEIRDVIEEAAGSILRSIEVFDVFQGEQSGPGKKSVAFHLVFGSEDHTLTGEEREAVEKRVAEELEKKGYPLRR